MTADWTFVSGLVVTLGLSVAAVRYLKTPLLHILVDLCGSENRAMFWVAFTNIVLTSIPAIFALRSYPSQGLPAGAVFAIGDQLESGLIGLSISVVVLGLVLSHFVAHAARTETK